MFNNDKLMDIFFLIIKFIISKNASLNLSVSLYDGNYEYEEDSDIFFKAGQLIMFLYIFSINGLSKKDINYKNGTFQLNLKNENFTQKFCLNTDSNSIAYDIIRNSVFTKECFPSGLDTESIRITENFNSFIGGFQMCYQTFLDEKINLIDFLNNMDLNTICFNLIKNIKILTPQDCRKQIHFLEIKNNMFKTNDNDISTLVLVKDDYSSFLDKSVEILDNVIQNSIIGINSSGDMEISWIRHLNTDLFPLGKDNIYLALYFSYISKLTSNSYYYQSAKSSVMPLLKMNSLALDEDIVKAMYLLNSYMDFNELKTFINENNDIFKNLPESYKNKCALECHNLIFSCIMRNSLNVINSLVLV